MLLDEKQILNFNLMNVKRKKILLITINYNLFFINHFIFLAYICIYIYICLLYLIILRRNYFLNRKPCWAFQSRITFSFVNHLREQIEEADNIRSAASHTMSPVSYNTNHVVSVYWILRWKRKSKNFEAFIRAQ